MATLVSEAAIVVVEVVDSSEEDLATEVVVVWAQVKVLRT